MRTHRRRGLTWVCGGVVAAGLLASCSVLPLELPARDAADRAVVQSGLGPSAARPAGSAARPSVSPAAERALRPNGPPAASLDPTLGAFLSPGAEGVRRIRLLETWLGGTALRVGHTYLPGDRWSNIEGQPSFLAPWAQWRRARHDRMFVLNVPMQERNEAKVSDAEVRRLLRSGVSGRFDGHFRALARQLVRLKVPDTVIVLGWEMNGTTYTHRCGPDPEAWKKYWRRIVTTMRSVPGQKFRFDFAPNRGRDAVPWTRCYPGDDVVDVIGMDTYDQPAGKSFDAQAREPYGLQAQVDFAAKHRKPVSYPEWGLFHNGDNPEFVRRMLGWFKQHKPLYQTLTDYCPHGLWQCPDNPNSSETYRAALYGRTGLTPAPTWSPGPSRTPAPTALPSLSPSPVPTARPGDAACFTVGNLCIRFDRLDDWDDWSSQDTPRG